MADAARAAITAPTTRPAAMPPTEPARRNELPTRSAAPPSPQRSTPDGAAPTDPTWWSAAQQSQPSVHTGPTQYRPATDPSLGTPLRDDSTATGRGILWKRHRVAIAAGVAVVAVLAVVAAVVVSNSGDSSPAARSPTALPNTGPFTGTFTADFGRQLDAAGEPSEGARRHTRRRGVCGRYAGPAGVWPPQPPVGSFPRLEVVFDDVGGRWLAVSMPAATAPGKCEDLTGERFDVVSLQPRPDGTMTGEWTTSNPQARCFHKRTVTFTRTGDTDVGILADPASLPPRVVSPAEAPPRPLPPDTRTFPQRRYAGLRLWCANGLPSHRRAMHERIP